MFTKTTGFFIVPVWMVATCWLIAHDVWPRWAAHDAPPLCATDWLRNEGRQSHYTINDEFGSFGEVWSEYQVDESSIGRSDLIWIRRLPPAFSALTPLRIRVESSYTTRGVLDEITVRLEGQRADVKLHGERFHSDFSFRLDSGIMEPRAFKIPLASAGTITGAFNPFGALTNLHVGQSWNMQIVNPLAVLTGVGNPFIPLLVEVTGEERLASPAGTCNCMIVEAQGAKAWVDAHGNVLRQEVLVPLLGKLTIDKQPAFDEKGRNEIRNTPLSGRRS